MEKQDQKKSTPPPFGRGNVPHKTRPAYRGYPNALSFPRRKVPDSPMIRHRSARDGKSASHLPGVAETRPFFWRFGKNDQTVFYPLPQKPRHPQILGFHA